LHGLCLESTITHRKLNGAAISENQCFLLVWSRVRIN
jgi:hypothetical protein